jgi:YVTN family beta-propeller protein
MSSLPCLCFGNKMKAMLGILIFAVTSLSLGALGVASSSRPEGNLILPAPADQAEKSPKRAEQAQPATDFETYRQRVEPIFLKQRPGHARCYSCHSLLNRVFHLETLSPGATDWSAEQSQKNFQSALQLIVPGHPESSWLLLHPLAPEAGGHPFHSGGRQFESKDDPDWQTLSEWVRGTHTAAAPDAASHSNSRIYVTNSAGNTVDVIDPAFNKVVQTIRGIELPHGVAFSPDGARVYVSNESESVLDVIDQKNGEILSKIPLSGRPNNIAIAKDGSRVIVGIRTDPGVVDVIDTTALSRVKSIPVDGSVHNVYVTPDGKYAVSGSIENKAATVIDLQSEQAIWEVKFDSSVRPMAFESNPDGSTRRIFVQLTALNGFAVVDFAKRAEVTRVHLPDQPGGFGGAEGRTGTPSHGIGVAPDGKSLWVNSTVANATFEYSLPDLKLLGHTALPEIHSPGNPAIGSVPEWITFTPDSKIVYVSNSGARSVSAIDMATLKLITVIPVGEVPKRINTLFLD